MGHFLHQIPKIRRPLCHELSRKFWVFSEGQGNTGLWRGQKGLKRVAWKCQEVCFLSLHLSKLLSFWVLYKRKGRIRLSSLFLLISWHTKKSRSKSLWIFFIILQDRRNRSRNICWALAFLRGWRGCIRLNTQEPWPQGPSHTFEDTKQTPCLIQATTYSFI